MTATIHHFPAPAQQAPPSEEASFLSLVYEMGKAEGERLAYEAMRRRPPSRSRPAVLAFTGPPS
jgi:hypothetical protein